MFSRRGRICKKYLILCNKKKTTRKPSIAVFLNLERPNEFKGLNAALHVRFLALLQEI